MTVTDSMYIQVYKYIPYKLCIYGIYNGVGLYIPYGIGTSQCQYALVHFFRAICTELVAIGYRYAKGTVGLQSE